MFLNGNSVKNSSPMFMCNFHVNYVVRSLYLLFVCMHLPLSVCGQCVCSVHTKLGSFFPLSIFWPGQWLKVSSGADQVKFHTISLCVTYVYFGSQRFEPMLNYGLTVSKKKIFYSFGQRLQFHIRMHWATQSELKPICAMRTLWSRNSRSRTFGRVIAVFFLLRRFNNNKKTCVCVSHVYSFNNIIVGWTQFQCAI